MNPYPWEQPFCEALSQDDLASAVKALYEMGGIEKRRYPRDREFRRALEPLREVAPNPEQCWSWGVKLIEDHLSTTLGVKLVITFFPDRSDDIAALWLWLAEHPDWERREDAAWMLSELLVADFDIVYTRCLEWVHHSSENVRRAVAVGVKIAAKVRTPEWGERFLDLLEPLLSDRSVYVRQNLCPFAIGDGLLRCYPELTLKRLAAWARRSDEQARWNVAMAFSAAEAVQHVEAALPILTELAADERRFVWRAVASAMRNLGRRQPTQVVPILQGWLRDERRWQVAEVALRYL